MAPRDTFLASHAERIRAAERMERLARSLRECGQREEAKAAQEEADEMRQRLLSEPLPIAVT